MAIALPLSIASDFDEVHVVFKPHMGAVDRIFVKKTTDPVDSSNNFPRYRDVQGVFDPQHVKCPRM